MHVAGLRRAPAAFFVLLACECFWAEPGEIAGSANACRRRVQFGYHYKATFPYFLRIREMAKPHRKPKKANHGRRPANSKHRRLKRAVVRT